MQTFKDNSSTNSSQVAYYLVINDVVLLEKPFGIWSLKADSEKEAIQMLNSACGGTEETLFQDQWGEPNKINTVEEFVKDVAGASGAWCLYKTSPDRIPEGFNFIPNGSAI